MTAPKIAPPAPEAPLTPRRRTARADASAKKTDKAAAPATETPSRSAELMCELKAIALILFGLFLAGALIAVGVSSLRAGYNASGAVGVIGKILVQPIVWLFGWPA